MESNIVMISIDALIGFSDHPYKIVKLSDDKAAILLVESNLHRENVLPSEKAY